MKDDLVWTEEGWGRLSVLMEIHKNKGKLTSEELKQVVDKYNIDIDDIDSIFVRNSWIKKTRNGSVKLTRQGKKASKTPIKYLKSKLEE